MVIHTKKKYINKILLIPLVNYHIATIIIPYNHILSYPIIKLIKQGSENMRHKNHTRSSKKEVKET